MSKEDDIFLKTFNEMISLLNDMNSNLVDIKKSVELILPSIDGLGAGITNVNTQITDLKKKMEVLSENLLESTQKTEAISKPVSKPKKEKPIKTTKVEKTKAEISQDSVTPHTSPKHPIFIDLNNKLNEAKQFKEIGELLIEALEQIESNFSFSRVFYEIRRVGNSLIRKGQKDMPPKEKLELNEKLLDWESRLSE